MEFFDIQDKKEDAATIISRLFNEFKEIEKGKPSRNISPSGLACPICCALKLRGIPTEATKESFRSRSYADNGTDRHARIQAFLSKTPYWVNVFEFVKSRQLDLEPIIKVNTGKYSTKEKPLPDAILYEDADKFLAENKLPKDALFRDKFEVLLKHKTLPFRFKCDGILLIDGVYYVLEIKTEADSVNNYRTSYAAKHQKQGIAYTWLFGVSNLLWLYEGRGVLEQKLFVQYVTEAEKKELAEYVDSIIKNKEHIENLVIEGNPCRHDNYKQFVKEYFKALKKEKKNAKTKATI